MDTFMWFGKGVEVITCIGFGLFVLRQMCQLYYYRSTVCGIGLC